MIVKKCNENEIKVWSNFFRNIKHCLDLVKIYSGFDNKNKTKETKENQMKTHRLSRITGAVVLALGLSTSALAKSFR